MSTGDWGAAGERDAARPGVEDEEDGDAFGEFEDLETGKPQAVMDVTMAAIAIVMLYSSSEASAQAKTLWQLHVMLTEMHASGSLSTESGVNRRSKKGILDVLNFSVV